MSNIERHIAYSGQDQRYYSPEYVAERLKAAAETDRKMPRVGPQPVKSGHPDTLSESKDQFLFGENWRENLRNRVLAITHVTPDRESIRKMDEAMSWLTFLKNVDRAKALWCWACGIPDHAIASRMRKARRTIGYWRDVDLQAIAKKLCGG